MKRERYLITGGSGFIGAPLVQGLVQAGHEVTVLTRDCVKTAQHFASLLSEADNRLILVNELQKLDAKQSYDVIINLAGQGIADKRWTSKIKQQLVDSRIQTTRKLCHWVIQMPIKPRVFISGSALGYYGVGTDPHPVDETGQPDDSFSSQLCMAWEKEAACLEPLGVRTCYLRTGIVLGDNGGALAKMLPAFKWGLGGPLGSGEQWMSWIHREDLIGIIHYLIDHEELRGHFNGCAPKPVKNKEFSRTLGKALKRPACLPMPALVLKLLLGEMAEELLLSGKPVVPKKILEAGYVFQYPHLEEALEAILS